ncbi:class I SAM-dependent methyltransferase [Nannocystis pusilla]|uniref:class I SAM-dependent methyltransferase n=1 Tax=Nannocystis pusilla TaxID=889268 RepID=UPI003B7A5732
MTDTNNYALADAAHDAELARLRTIEADWDAKTRRHLQDLGVGPGQRCLEVGAGAGGVARWLSGQVGPGGKVVATDIDPRFLADLKADNLEVRRHDIAVDPLETDSYDLVHCRVLLIHMRDPAAVLRRMFAALRPAEPSCSRRPPAARAPAFPAGAAPRPSTAPRRDTSPCSRRSACG